MMFCKDRDWKGLYAQSHDLWCEDAYSHPAICGIITVCEYIKLIGNLALYVGVQKIQGQIIVVFVIHEDEGRTAATMFCESAKNAGMSLRFPHGGLNKVKGEADIVADCAKINTLPNCEGNYRQDGVEEQQEVGEVSAGKWQGDGH